MAADLQVQTISGFTLQYEALSYCWGHLPPTCELLVDSHVVLISPTLERALRRLQLWDEHRLLWIDTLCIDQRNVDERNLQVGMMGDIYRNASKVNVWLDDPAVPPHSDACAPASPLWKRCFHVIECVIKWEDHILRTIKRHIREQDLPALHDLCPNGVAILRDFFALPYWSRLWVVQELVLGRDIVFLDAMNECSLHELVRVQYRIVQYARKFDSENAEPIDAAIPFIIQTQNISRKNPKYPGMGLTGALDRFRSAKATDPRDKVFGLLGIVERTVALKPDYLKSVEQVYHDCALTLLKTYKRLDFLSSCIASPSLATKSGMASWIPDWSKSLPRGVQSLSSLSNLYPFHASKPLDTPIGVLRDAEIAEDVLRVEGVRVGIIQETLGFPSHRPEGREWLPDIAQRQGLDASAFQRILAVDRNPEGSVFTAPFIRPRDVSQYNTTEDGHHAAELGRCFYSTDNGRCGLAYEFVQVNDHVCIIFGCSMPIVLRPAGAEAGHYFVLGEAFVDGCMMGEAVEALERGELQKDTFYLQ